MQRFPTRLFVDLASVNSVRAIVPRPILHKIDPLPFVSHGDLTKLQPLVETFEPIYAAVIPLARPVELGSGTASGANLPPLTKEDIELICSTTAAFFDATKVKQLSHLVEGSCSLYEIGQAAQDGSVSDAQGAAIIELAQFLYGVAVTALTVPVCTAATGPFAVPCTVAVVGVITYINQDDWAVIESALAQWLNERQQ